MKISNPILMIVLGFVTPLWAGENTATVLTPAGDSGTSETSVLGDAIRPCLCHGAYAGSAEPFSVNLTVGYDSSYFCRGMDVGDDLLHVTGTLDYRLTDWITWTGSFRYQDVTDVDFTELQAYTGVFFNVGQLSIGPSFRWYEFRPDGGEMTAYDLGVQALYKAGPVNLIGGYFYETESKGHYLEFGVSSVIPLHERISLVPSAQISYTDGWLMPMLSGFNVVDLRLSLPIKVADHVRLTPYIGGVLPLEALDDMQDNKLVGGVSLALTF